MLYGLLTYGWHFGSKDTTCKYFEGLNPPLAHQGWQRRKHQMLGSTQEGEHGVGEDPAVRGRNPVGEREIVGVQRSLAHSSDDQLRSAGASACATTHLANH